MGVKVVDALICTAADLRVRGARVLLPLHGLGGTIVGAIVVVVEKLGGGLEEG
jgi:hypothetical protein